MEINGIIIPVRYNLQLCNTELRITSLTKSVGKKVSDFNIPRSEDGTWVSFDIAYTVAEWCNLDKEFKIAVKEYFKKINKNDLINLQTDMFAFERFNELYKTVQDKVNYYINNHSFVKDNYDKNRDWIDNPYNYIKQIIVYLARKVVKGIKISTSDLRLLIMLTSENVNIESEYFFKMNSWDKTIKNLTKEQIEIKNKCYNLFLACSNKATLIEDKISEIEEENSVLDWFIKYKV